MQSYAANLATATQIALTSTTDEFGTAIQAGDMPSLPAGTYRIAFFEVGVTPTITTGFLNNIASVDVVWSGTAVVSGGTTTIQIAAPISVSLGNGAAVQQDFRCAVGETLLQPVVFSNPSGTAPNYTGQTITLKIFDLDQNVMGSPITGTVSTTATTGDTVEFNVPAADDLEDAVDPSSFLVRIWNDTAGQRLTFGALIVDAV